MTRVDPEGRRRARESALQILYQAEVGRMGPQEAIGSFWRIDRAGDVGGEEVAADQQAFANELARETLARAPEIDQLIAAQAQNWRLERMAIIDRLVLRLAICELLTHRETPPKVVINEALELARTFSGESSVGFVNGVLDAVRKELPEA
jgi:N utilization substance protein B